MSEEIASENGRIFNFEGLVTLTLDQVIMHTIVHHSATSTYTSNFIEIEETFCVETYICTCMYAHMYACTNVRTDI